MYEPTSQEIYEKMKQDRLVAAMMAAFKEEIGLDALLDRHKVGRTPKCSCEDPTTRHAIPGVDL